MRVTQIKAKNFASYAELDFDLTNKGLVLIHGATGSGKSTLCDLLPWCLFGRTAKDGSVDEVISWNSTEPTEVILYLQDITVSRKRGKRPQDNDLTFWPTDGEVTRGKDLNDTQKLLNARLGVDLDAYLASSYFHEFSQSAGFFTAAAKTRRLICEQIVDLDLPKKLTEKASDCVKFVTKDLNTRNRDKLIVETAISTLESRLLNTKSVEKHWERQQVIKLKDLAEKDKNYAKFLEKEILELNKERVSLISKLHIHIPTISGQKTCVTCGAPNKLARDAERLQHQNQLLEVKITSIEQQIEKLPKDNPYERQLRDTKADKNPHSSEIASLQQLITKHKDERINIENQVARLESELFDYEILIESATTMRSQLIAQAVEDIQDNTNTYLSKYFDAEIKVEFLVEAADKLDVTIYKDGNECSYTQLSKGQRQLLKLCFGISIMKQAANNSLTSFSQIFMDESLDGLDEVLKVKAYGLLQELSTTYESVFVVEHSTELKACFPNRIKVQLIQGHSEISED